MWLTWIFKNGHTCQNDWPEWFGTFMSRKISKLPTLVFQIQNVTQYQMTRCAHMLTQAHERQASLITSWLEFVGRKLHSEILFFNWQSHLKLDPQGTISCDARQMTRQNAQIPTVDSENACVPTLHFALEFHFLRPVWKITFSNPQKRRLFHIFRYFDSASQSKWLAHQINSGQINNY